MSYVALYRKYRPKAFNEVYGQSAIVQTLQNQVKLNRVAHAYLFSGPRGTGKTSIAKILSRAVNCQSPVNGSPCWQCECCTNVNTDIVEIDAASNNGVDNIRELIEESKYMPQHGAYKVYIIDEVHMLSSSAFNALLKTLEDPPVNVVFILATTDYYKVPATISSRCQHYQFKLISETVIAEALQEILEKENIEYEDEKALMHVAKMAKGGLRDALSLLDHCIPFATGPIDLKLIKEVFGEIDDVVIEEMVTAIEKKDLTSLFSIISEQEQLGKSLSNICNELYSYYRNRFFNNNAEENIIFQRYMQILAELSEKMKYNNNRSTFEVEMIKMCVPQMEKDYNALHQRLQQLEDIVAQLVDGRAEIASCKEADDCISFHVNIPCKVSTIIYS